jgi:bifunctional DNase/RNase
VTVEMTVHGVGQSPDSGAPLVLLKQKEQDRFVVIGIGPLELTAIATAAMNQPAPRPLTADLLVSALQACGARVERILIHAIIEGAFHARIVLDVQGRYVELDARSSDAIAVALRVGTPIHVEEAVLDKAGFTPKDEPGATGQPGQPGQRGQLDPPGAARRERDRTPPGERISEDQLGAFRDVIKGLDLDDLGKRDPAA